MKRDTLFIKTLFFIFLFSASLKSYCQDTTAKYSFDTTIIPSWTSFTVEIQMSFDFLDHFPDEEDESNVKSYGYLTRQLPDSNNYDKYYSLACSLWELNSLTKAEKMFLNIINSNEKYYSTTYDHSSDIPGDFSSALYGYGHFSSNYKNSAAIHLAKIYIEKKEFDKGLSFLEDAIKKYEVSYSCGTGYRNQQDEYNFLYGCIYEGQKDYDKVMDLLLPECLTRDDEIIVRVIKKKYSREEIKEKLQLAENSIQCEFDTEPSFTYLTVGGNAERTDTITYYSGKAVINLFDKEVKISRPRLKNSERVTKEHFLREFRRSSFYKNLALGKEL